MQVSREIVESLKGESSTCSVALSYMKEKIEEFEPEYSMNIEESDEKCGERQSGHDQNFLKWNAHTEYYNNWQTHKKALEENCGEQENFAFCAYNACRIHSGEPHDK
jgi:hypothetical protein